MRRPSSAGGKPDDRQRRPRHAEAVALERRAVREPAVTEPRRGDHGLEAAPADGHARSVSSRSAVYGLRTTERED